MRNVGWCSRVYSAQTRGPCVLQTELALGDRDVVKLLTLISVNIIFPLFPFPLLCLLSAIRLHAPFLCCVLYSNPPVKKPNPSPYSLCSSYHSKEEKTRGRRPLVNDVKVNCATEAQPLSFVTFFHDVCTAWSRLTTC